MYMCMYMHIYIYIYILMLTIEYTYIIILNKLILNQMYGSDRKTHTNNSWIR